MKSYYYSALLTMTTTERINTGIFKTKIIPNKKNLPDFLNSLCEYIAPQVPENIRTIDILGWAPLN